MRISVIVPVLNEAACIVETLARLRQQEPDEIIVVDGGSTDETVARATPLARVVASARGRAAQMNAGAAAATGDGLLFLHADTRLPTGGIEMVRETLRGGRQAGRFRLSFDAAHPILSIYAWFTRFSVFSYGDQAFFMHRSVFEALGGFSPSASFEDIDMWRRLRPYRPVILSGAVTTSARRFEKYGVVRQQLINGLILLAAHGGWDLRPWLYPDVRGAQGKDKREPMS